MNGRGEAVLFPSMPERLELEHWLTEQLGHALAAIPVDGVSPTIDIDAFTDRLSAMNFNAPCDPRETMRWVIEGLQQGSVQMTHPGYFGLFNPAPTHPAECADRIASAFNPQICVWSHAPVAVELEQHVITQLARRIGLGSNAGGHFTSGGSEANRTAVVCALTRLAPDFTDIGAKAFCGQPRIYASKESHLAWLKIAHESGIGRNAVALIATDGVGRLDANALKIAIEQDQKAGYVPVMIAATAGTTNAGMIDPLIACRSLANQFDLWLHVDAAWGGALICSDRYRNALTGIETADSITIDAHKWFATTMGAGMFLTNHRNILADVFHVATDYMPSNDQSVDLYVNSMQWSRRFVGLRLFLALAAAGWEGYAQHIEHGVALIHRLNEAMKDAGWSIANVSTMAVTCLVPPNGSATVESIVNHIVNGNEHWVSMTRFEGKSVVRVCVTNGRTADTNIDALAQALVIAASPSATT